MAARRFAWVLNLDADLELAAGRGYSPRKSVREATQAFVPRLASSLLGPDDVLVDESSAPMVARGLPGRAFCPTPRALAALRRAGAEPEPCPEVDVLRRVNSRAFCAELGPSLPGSLFARELEVALAKLSEPAPAFALAGAWRLKRAFGMTGRGQKVLAKAASLAEADLAFLRAGIDEGGVQIEPNVAIAREYALHGMLDAAGALVLGGLVEQRCDARGAWLTTELLPAGGAASDAEQAIARRLREQATRVGAALTREGYFGPFGIDAYTYRDELGEVHFQAASEINARYSMGFAVGWNAERGGAPVRVG